MINRSKFLSINRFTIIVMIVILLFIITPISYSKFFSKANSTADVDTAFYILKADYYEVDIAFDDIVPSNDVYTYNFAILNNDGKDRVETNMEYTLKIITTTNLPISYSLYKNQKYTDSDKVNIIKSDVIARDSDLEDATYFRTLTTEKEVFGFKKDEENIYQLVISFPLEYNSYDYQGIIEGIKISIESKQVTL